jgi:hypothetical protein
MLEQTLSRTDVLDVCAVMLQRCGLSAAQLAEHMGRPDLPSAAPQPPQPTQRAVELAQLTPRMIETLDLCDCEEGMTVQALQEVLGIAMQTAFSYLSGLHQRDLVTRQMIPGIRAARFFRHAAQATAWVASQEKAKPISKGEARSARAAAKRAAKAAKAAGRIAAQAMKATAQPPKVTVLAKPKPVTAKPPGAPTPTGEPTNPNGVEPTRAVTPVDTRYFLAADEPLTGGFSTTRPGINPMTGKAWGQ